MSKEAQSVPAWEQICADLRVAEPQFYELEPGGPLALQLPDEDWLLELTPDGRLICQTGMAMDDIQSLLSDGTPEDLGTDELAKQAKYYLQPAVGKFRKSLVEAGFTENTEMTDAYVAVTFERAVDLQNFSDLLQTVRWCKQTMK